MTRGALARQPDPRSFEVEQARSQDFDGAFARASFAGAFAVFLRRWLAVSGSGSKSSPTGCAPLQQVLAFRNGVSM
jgi:hypothetical protein